MTGSIGRASSMNKYQVTRLGRKLQIADDPRILLALPKDVPERTWVEILQKEENELVCLDIREEILDAALKIGYEHYMEKQNTFFQVHCTAVALLKIIDWHFYRHDPGEDPTAYPPCFIPKRLESWTPDELPDPAVKDSWGRRELDVLEPAPEEMLPSTRYSAVSVEMPYVEPIPEEYWFPGRVNLTTIYVGRDGILKRHVMDEEDPGYPTPGWGCFDRVSMLCSDDYDDSDHTIDRLLDHSSEVLQRITNYSSNDETPSSPCGLSNKESKHSSLKLTTPVDGSLRGAGDSTIDRATAKRRSHFSKSKSGILRTRSRLPPLMAASESKISIISDCRLRNLRLETHYEVSMEKVDSPDQAERPIRKKP